jgi:hypothetical protein
MGGRGGGGTKSVVTGRRRERERARIGGRLAGHEWAVVDAGLSPHPRLLTAPFPFPLCSFNNIRYWMENIQKHASPHTLKVLLGNKIDVKGRKVRRRRSASSGGEAGSRPDPTRPVRGPPSRTPPPTPPPPPPHKHNQIESSRGKALADEYGMRFFETSAKDGTSVADAFNSLARDVVGKILAAGGGGAAGGDGAGADGGKTGKGDKKEKDCAVM